VAYIRFFLIKRRDNIKVIRQSDGQTPVSRTCVQHRCVPFGDQIDQVSGPFVLTERVPIWREISHPFVLPGSAFKTDAVSRSWLPTEPLQVSAEEYHYVNYRSIVRKIFIFP
jgi:hypothetical protein